MDVDAPALSGDLRAEVVSVEAARCRTPQAADCRVVGLRLQEGPDRGRTVRVRSGESLSEPDVDVGDELRVVRNDVPAGTPAGAIEAYTVTDFERRAPLLWLAIAFALVALIVGGRRGARALIGLVLSVAVIFGFIVPAMLDGQPPVAVALTGALAIMLATILVTHGAGLKSFAAIMGTTSSLAITVAIGAAFVELAHLTGLTSDASTLLLAGRPDLSLEGIILAGLVIGALGVLDDVTVSQASTVLALARANPAMPVRRLYREALDVGRDHATATVNTLVLAYVGAALPVLLIFHNGSVDAGDALNSEMVGKEVVAMLAGSIGLLAAVPLTTLLTAWLAGRVDRSALPAGHLHSH